MTVRAKIAAAVASVALAVAAVSFLQERRQHAIIAGVRGAVAVGDPPEKVGRVFREYGLQPERGKDGRIFAAHVWFHFRPDVSLIVVLNGHRHVWKTLVEERAD